jgi:hypothetical protein
MIIIIVILTFRKTKNKINKLPTKIIETTYKNTKLWVYLIRSYLILGMHLIRGILSLNKIILVKK